MPISDSMADCLGADEEATITTYSKNIENIKTKVSNAKNRHIFVLTNVYLL